jgi:hypothetical protein
MTGIVLERFVATIAASLTAGFVATEPFAVANVVRRV